jgi:outer membrane protein assembly factor BamB
VTSPHSAASASAVPTRLALPAAPLSVYVGSTDGTVAALGALSGTLRWRSVVAGNASAATVAALADGALYVTATNPNQQPLTTVLAVLRASDGAILWQTVRPGRAAIVATGSGVAYVAVSGDSAAHEVQMLRALDGEMLWHTPIEGAGPLHASLQQGTIYVTSFTTQEPSPGYFYASTIVYALNAGTGVVSWRHALARTDYLATVAGGAVYLVDSGTDVVCEPQVLHVLSAPDGTERWHTEGTLLRLIGVEPGRAYVATVPEGCAALAYDHSALAALNTSDGSTAWQVDVPSAFDGPLASGVIYLPGAGTILAAYRVRDGSQLWQVQSESGRVWVVGQGLYTSVLAQGLDALDPATGAVRWRYRPGDDVSLATVTYGTVYGIRSRQIPGSSRSQAIVALATSDGELLWTFPIGTSQDSPIAG